MNTIEKRKQLFEEINKLYPTQYRGCGDYIAKVLALYYLLFSAESGMAPMGKAHS